MRLSDKAELIRKLWEAEWWDKDDRGKAMDIVLDAPTVDAKPVRRGRWLVGGQCSLCGKFDTRDPFGSAYCLHCGAKMDGGKPDENA